MLKVLTRHTAPFGVAAIAALAVGLAALIGCARPLPEQDSYAGQLYMRRCGGQCHAPYDPRVMTPAMWQVQVAAMEAKMQAAGLQPLSSDQRDTILSYLTRNAGTR